MAIHDKLIMDLCTGYFGISHRVAGNYTKWKICYKHYCPLPAENGETVFDDICTLQHKKLIGVGEYDVLLDIFKNIDETAIEIIKKASDSIRQNNETETEDQREPKSGGKHFIYLFSRFVCPTNIKLTDNIHFNRLLCFAIQSVESKTKNTEKCKLIDEGGNTAHPNVLPYIKAPQPYISVPSTSVF